MAKKTNSDTVKIKRGSNQKEISKAQWAEMKKTNTYGWVAASDLPKDVVDKDAQLELSKIAELENSVKDANAKASEFEAQVKTLTSESEAKDTKIAELEKALEAAKSKAEPKKK